jgi:hypothetical protein
MIQKGHGLSKKRKKRRYMKVLVLTKKIGHMKVQEKNYIAISSSLPNKGERVS